MLFSPAISYNLEFGTTDNLKISKTQYPVSLGKSSGWNPRNRWLWNYWTEDMAQLAVFVKYL